MSRKGYYVQILESKSHNVNICKIKRDIIPQEVERGLGVKIFIGSSSNAYGKAIEIAEIVEFAGYTAEPWRDSNIFAPGRFIFQCVENAAIECDAAIFVFR